MIKKLKKWLAGQRYWRAWRYCKEHSCTNCKYADADMVCRANEVLKGENE